MKEEKSFGKKYRIILLLIAVVFCGVAFAVPFNRGAVFWTALIFEMLAIILQIPVFRMAFEGRESLKSKFLGFPVFRVGYIYLAVQTIASLVLFKLGDSESFTAWKASAICIVLLGGAVFCSIVAESAAGIAERIEVSDKQKTAVFDELKVISAGLVSITDDAEMKKALSALAEDIRFSDPVSSEASEDAEEKLMTRIKDLSGKLKSGEAAVQDIAELRTMLTERNNIVKMSK